LTSHQISLSQELDEELTQQNSQRHDWIEQLGAQDRCVSSKWYQRVADLRVSTTDPDASLMLTKDGAHLGYHTHYVVDGGKARIILQALVTPSEVMDNQPMLDLLWRVRFRWKLRHNGKFTFRRSHGYIPFRSTRFVQYVLLHCPHRKSFRLEDNTFLLWYCWNVDH
jgi:hypothetical protein